MKEVKVYSTSSCVYCDKVKDWLKENDIKYEEIDITENSEERDDLIAKTGMMGVPVIKIGDELIVGFNEVRMKELLDIE